MKIKHTFTLYCLPFTLALFLVSCGTSGDGNGGASFEASDVSAANCADAAALNCFISQWDTRKTANGASYTNTIVLPLVENGEYDFYVDWGDETAIENITEFDAIEVTHTYAEEGEYTIHIAGEIKGWRFFVSEADNEIDNSIDDFGDAVKLLDVSQWGSLSLGNTDGRQFQGAANFNATASDAPDLSETTDLSYAFANASKFNAEIGNWDVATVTNMEFMFFNAAAFDQDLSKWNVCKVTGTGWGSFDAGAAATWTAQEKPNWGMACPGGDDGGDTGRFADVSEANCADVDAGLSCFISVWNTAHVPINKDITGFSGTMSVKLPLVEGGTYDFYVDWGDGKEVEKITSSADATHTYTTPGEYTIHIAGIIKGWRFFVSEASLAGSVNDFGDAVKLLDVSQWGSLSLGNTAGRQFRGAENFNPTATDAPDLSETTSLISAFYGASSFNADISDWDVSKVTNMPYMFNLATSFNNNGKPLDWGNKTSKVTSMKGMFASARAFNEDIGGWNVSNVTTMNAMFFKASSFNNKDGEKLDWGDKTSNVTDMGYMFNNAKAFNQDISDWDVENVRSFDDFATGSALIFDHIPPKFRGLEKVSQEVCGAKPELNCFISTWNTENSGNGASASSNVVLPLVNNGEYNFYVDWGDETAIENITGYDDTKAAHTHEYEDEGEYTIHIAGEIKGWRFFVSGDGVGTVDDFGDAVKLLDVSQWGSLSLGNTAGRQFQGAANFNPTASDAPNLSETTNLAAAFKDASVFNGAIGNWDVSTITTMESMFYQAEAFDQELSAWNVSGVTTMHRMFQGAISFDSPLVWAERTQNVTSMQQMFQGATRFNQNISGWNVSGVTTMQTMFNDAVAFDQDLSAWDVSAVTTMERMFFGAGTFNGELLWKQKTKNVTSMNRMFAAAKLFNKDISDWNVSSVSDMTFMFWGARAFDQDLSKWNVCKVTARGLFDYFSNRAWSAAEKPKWDNPDCPTN